MKGKGSSSSTAKFYFSRINIDFPSYWLKGQVLHYREQGFGVRLVATAESQAKWRPRNVLSFPFSFFLIFLHLYNVIPIS